MQWLLFPILACSLSKILLEFWQCADRDWKISKRSSSGRRKLRILSIIVNGRSPTLDLKDFNDRQHLMRKWSIRSSSSRSNWQLRRRREKQNLNENCRRSGSVQQKPRYWTSAKRSWKRPSAYWKRSTSQRRKASFLKRQSCCLFTVFEAKIMRDVSTCYQSSISRMKRTLSCSNPCGRQSSPNSGNQRGCYA